MSEMRPGRPTSTHRRRAARVLTAGAAALAMTALGNASAFAAPPSSPTPSPSPPAGSSASPMQSTPTERAAAEVRPAIVYLTETFTGYVADETGQYFNDGQPYSLSVTCTGFGVNPNGYIATAGHCVDVTSPTGIRTDFIEAAARDAVANHPGVSLQDAYDYGLTNWTVEGKAKGSPVDSEIAVVTGSLQGGTQGRALPARIVDSRAFEQGDVALLKVEATDLPSVELATDSDVQIGTSLLSIGYPASADAVTDPTLEPSNKDGQVSAKKTVGSVPVYETSAALTPGMSGGPTVDLEGRVLGLNSFFISGESNFNFIAPSSGLQELLSRNGVKNEIGAEDKTFRSGLDAYYAGHYTEAIADFDKLLQVAPQHAQATQFRTLAAKARDKYGDTAAPAAAPAPESSSGLPFDLSPVAFWSILGGGGALAVGLAVLLTVRLRRRGESGPEAGTAIAFPPLPSQPLSGPAFGQIPAQPLPSTYAAPVQGGAQAPAWLNRSDATVDMGRVNGSTPAAVLTATREDCTRCGTRLAAEQQFCGTCGRHRS